MQDMMVSGMFGQEFGKVPSGRCRLAMTGGIAIYTENGYKTYDVEKGRCVNCNNFVLDVGDDIFFYIPAMRVQRGDIIIVNRKPKCVIAVEKNKIEVFSYETDTIEFIVPERHVFMGNAYMFRKIVSVFGNMTGAKKKNNAKNMMQNIMRFKFLSQMMQGNNGVTGVEQGEQGKAFTQGQIGNGNPMMQMLPWMMFMGNGNFDMENCFGFDMDMFGDEDDDDDDNDDNEDNVIGETTKEKVKEK